MIKNLLTFSIIICVILRANAQTELHNLDSENLTFAFIENKGQFDNRHMQASEIDYAIDYNGLCIFFTKHGLTYRFDKFIRNPLRSRQQPQEPKRICLSEIISVNWIAANPDVELLASDQILPYFSYAFYEKETRRVINENFIKGFQQLYYKNLYDNIDVEYISYPGKGIKYNIYLHPGADASQLKMKYDAFHSSHQQESIKFGLDTDGKILIKGSLGELAELSPIAFYEDTQEPVAIAFSYSNGVVGFEIKDYDKSRLLVIDPWIISPTFSSSNAVWEVETDSSGNVYVIGGESPMKLNKYNSAGVLQWSYTTPWDTAGYWLGTLTTDMDGTSYITAGSMPEIQCIDTFGNMVWNNSGLNNLCEYWTVVINCTDSNLIVGGTYSPNSSTYDFYSAVYHIDVNDGSVLSFHTDDSVNVTTLFAHPIEIRGMSVSQHAKVNYITHNSVGLLAQSAGACSNTPLYKVPLGYEMGYKCENYLPVSQNGGGLKAIISNDNFVYIHSGSQIHKRELATGALLASVNLPGGQSNIVLGKLIVRNCGLDVDACGNVYAGTSDRIVKFDTDLNVLAEEMTGFAVYDLSVNTDGKVIAVGAVYNNQVSVRNGKVISVNMNACAQFIANCCNTAICPVPAVNDTTLPFNLVAVGAGGVWSGTGITDPLTGTFDPVLAGPGYHKIYYTMPCGTDSCAIFVDTYVSNPINLKEEVFEIYPNPAKETLFLITSETEFETAIINVFGQVVLWDRNSTTIDISGLATGIYIFHLKSNARYKQKYFMVY